MRQCGGCTMCCKLLGINALSKPAGAWCPHCKPGTGCAIYADRPGECGTFNCHWLADPGMSDQLRPDRSKVVVYVDMEGQRLLARCDTANPMAWRQGAIYAYLKAAAKAAAGQNRFVMAGSGRRVWVIGPVNDVDLGEVDPASVFEVVPQPDGTLKAFAHPPACPPA